MQMPRLEERKNWWLKAYAHASFKKSLSCCEQLLKYVDSTLHDLYVPLSVTIHVFYGRPFKRQEGIGKLEQDFVPCQFSGTHRCLITFRDKILCHTDAGEVEEAGRPLHDLVYHRIRSDVVFSTSDPRPDLDFYKEVSKYLLVMIDKVRKEIDLIYGKFNELLPSSDGDYLLNVKGDKLFTPYQPPPNKLTFN